MASGGGGFPPPADPGEAGKGQVLGKRLWSLLASADGVAASDEGFAGRRTVGRDGEASHRWLGLSANNQQCFSLSENQQQPRASRTGRTLLATGAGVPGGVRSVDGESDVAAMASLMFAAPMLASPDLGLERASGSSKGKALAGEAMAAAAPTPELGLRMASSSSKGKGLAAEAIAAACVGGPSAPRAAGVGQLYAGAYMGEPSAHKALKFTVAGLERSRRAVHQALYGTGMPAMPPGFEEDTASSASPKSPAPGFVPASQAGSPAAAVCASSGFFRRKMH